MLVYPNGAIAQRLLGLAAAQSHFVKERAANPRLCLVLDLWQ